MPFLALDLSLALIRGLRPTIENPLQLQREVVGRLKPVIGALGQAGPNHPAESRW